MIYAANQAWLPNLPDGPALTLLEDLDTGSGSQQIITGAFANPNGNVTPDDATLPAIYYQDESTPVNQWNWSVDDQSWFPAIT